MERTSALAAFAILLGISGCAAPIAVVPRYELTDNTSGRHYVAEGREINKTARGVTFRDESGDHITLNSYSERRISDAHYQLKYDPWEGVYRRERRLD